MFLPDSGFPNWSFTVTVMSSWVSPSAGAVGAWATTVEAEADGEAAWKSTVGCCERVTPSVVSTAVNVTVSGTESVTGKETCPLESVVADDGVPTTADPLA
jgi:hypothetical protein